MGHLRAVFSDISPNVLETSGDNMEVMLIRYLVVGLRDLAACAASAACRSNGAVDVKGITL